MLNTTLYMAGEVQGLMTERECHGSGFKRLNTKHCDKKLTRNRAFPRKGRSPRARGVASGKRSDCGNRISGAIITMGLSCSVFEI